MIHITRVTAEIILVKKVKMIEKYYSRSKQQKYNVRNKISPQKSIEVLFHMN
jgi:hypothetical protein